jgi:hypothetical protein
MSPCTVRLARLSSALVYLTLLLCVLGGRAFAGEDLGPPEPVPPAVGPPPSLEEQILAPIPRQFDWLTREVRPNPPLESLLGLREGRRGLFMAVSLSEEYSDNFFLRERGREDEYRTSVEIGTVYRLEEGPSFVSLANTVSANYAVRSDQGHIGFANLSLNAGHRLPRLSLALNESFIRSDEVEEASLTPGPNSSPLGIRRARRPFLRNSISPQLRYDLSRSTTATFAYTNTLVREEGNQAARLTDVNTPTLDVGLGEGDSTSHAFRIDLQHSFTRNLSGTANYTYSTTDSTVVADSRIHSPAVDLNYLIDLSTSASLRAFGTISQRSNGGIDSQFYGASVGLRRQFTPALALFVAIGPTVFDREDKGPRLFANWQANLVGTLPITRRTTLALSTQQSIESTTGEVDQAGVILTSSARLTLRHAVSRDLFTSFFIAYTRTEFLENPATGTAVEGRKINFWTGGATVSYALTRILSLSADYRHQRRDSDVAGRDYDENRLTFGLSASFPIF